MIKLRRFLCKIGLHCYKEFTRYDGEEKRVMCWVCGKKKGN